MCEPDFLAFDRRALKAHLMLDLAYEAEVSRSYLSQLEKGAFYASLKIIGKLAEALGVEPAELLKRGAIEKGRR